MRSALLILSLTASQTYGGSLTISVSADRIHGSEGVSNRVCRAFEKRFELYLKLANEVLDAEKQD